MIIKKNAQGHGYNYTDLAQINRTLAESGLSYQQYIETHENGHDYIMTIMIDENGNKSDPIRGCKIPDANLPGKNNPAQEYGSALTYARRYSLLMAYGLATADDDAESLSHDFVIPKKKAEVLRQLINDKNKDESYVCAFHHVTRLEELTDRQYAEIVKWLEA